MKRNQVTGSREALRRIAVMLIALSLLGSCSAKRAYEKSLKSLDAGQYEEAIAQIERATHDQPGDAELRGALHRVREQSVQQLLREAEAYFAAGNLDKAEATFRRLLVIDPTNPRAVAGLESVRRAHRHNDLMQQARKHLDENEPNEALGKARAILSENAQHAEAAEMVAKIEATQESGAQRPIKLKSRYVKPVTLQFRDANVRMVFEALSKATGINFIFDNDIKPGLRVTVFVSQVSVENAIELILAQGQLAQKILNDNTMLIYPATPQKLKQYQEQVMRSFFLTNVDPKKAQSMLKTMLDASTTFIDDRARLLVVRDTPEVVRMAENLLKNLDLADPEVMLEVEVLEVKRSTLQRLGIDYPDSVSFTLTNKDGDPNKLTVEDLRNIDASRVLVSPLSVGVDITKEDTDANVLASPRIRARSGEKAKIHIGDRVPVITNSVTPVSTGTSVVTGTVQYLDTGLKLEIEPVVHLDNDVAIKINLEVSNIVREIRDPQSGSIAYQIGTRNASTLLRLRDGETQVLAGLISDEERTTGNKIPLVGDLPLLGRLFGTQKDDVIETEIVLSITPRLIRNLARPPAHVTEFWFGTEASKLGKPLSIQPMARSELPVVASAAPAATSAAGGPGPITDSQKAAVAPEIAYAPSAVEGEAPASEAAAVFLTLNGPDKAQVGAEFEFSAFLKAGRPVGKASFRLNFDPSVFEVASVAEGTIIGQSGSAESFSPVVDSKGGRISVNISSGAGTGMSGESDMAIITMRAIGTKPGARIAVEELNMVAPDGQALASPLPAPLVISIEP